MMTMVKRLISILLITLPLAANAEKETLGRLFYTPAERATLDRTRLGLPDEPDGKTTDTPVREPILNGYVKRSDGPSTIWIDGSPRYIRKSDEVLHPSTIRTPNNVTVRRSK